MALGTNDSATHRLFRSLVVSSALIFGAVGCELSHERMPNPPPPPDPDDGGPDTDAGLHPVDAGRGRASDAGAPDAGPPDAGAPDAGPPPDAGEPVPRACEPGWPTTKGFFCTTFDEDRVLCCPSDGIQEPCCLRETP